jgi:hypothetical protein
MAVRFDLSTLSSLPALRGTRATHWTGAALSALFASLLTVSLVVRPLVTGEAASLTAIQQVAIALFLALALLGVLIFFTTAPCPTGVTVGRTGVTYEYRRGRQTRLDWTRPGFRLRIERTDGVVRRGVQYPGFVVAIGGFPAQKYLTREAFDEIVRQARANGLTVAEGPSNVPGFARTTISRPP